MSSKQQKSFSTSFRAHARAAENHAMEIRLLAAWRIGELVPATSPEIKGKRAHGKELAEIRPTDLPEHQRLSEFRKLGAAGPFVLTSRHCKPIMVTFGMAGGSPVKRFGQQ